MFIGIEKWRASITSFCKKLLAVCTGKLGNFKDYLSMMHA